MVTAWGPNVSENMYQVGNCTALAGLTIVPNTSNDLFIRFFVAAFLKLLIDFKEYLHSNKNGWCS